MNEHPLGLPPAGSLEREQCDMHSLTERSALVAVAKRGRSFVVSLVQMRRLQGRPLLAYLYEVAHRKGLPAPSLVTLQ